MVDFHSGAKSWDSRTPDDEPTLDQAIGQRSPDDKLGPSQLLSLKAFKTPGSPKTSVSFGSLVVCLTGPLAPDPVRQSPEGALFKAQFFAAESLKGPVADVYIRENTGAFGIDGYVTWRELSMLIETIEQQLISSALERTTSFVENHLRPALTAGNSEERLAKLGVNLEYLKLIANETGCVEPEDLRSQSHALMKVLINKDLVGALITGLGGGGSIITSGEDSKTTLRLLGSVIDAFLVARCGITDYPVIPLHELLQNKTTLALVGGAKEEATRRDIFSVWTPVLPRN